MTLLEQLCEIAALQHLQQQHPPKSTKVTKMYPGGPGTIYQTTKNAATQILPKREPTDVKKGGLKNVGQGTTLPQDMDPNRFSGSSGFCGSTAQVTRAGNRGKDGTPTVATCIVGPLVPGHPLASLNCGWGSTTKHSSRRSQDG